jgi:hypothetical protein
MPEYIVTSPIIHDSRSYQPGKKITLDEAVAEPLLAVLVIGPAVVNRPNTAAAIAMVKAAETIETLYGLEIGEDRKSVLAAIETRRKELAPEGSE